MEQTLGFRVSVKKRVPPNKDSDVFIQVPNHTNAGRKR